MAAERRSGRCSEDCLDLHPETTVATKPLFCLAMRVCCPCSCAIHPVAISVIKLTAEPLLGLAGASMMPRQSSVAVVEMLSQPLSMVGIHGTFPAPALFGSRPLYDTSRLTKAVVAAQGACSQPCQQLSGHNRDLSNADSTSCEPWSKLQIRVIYGLCRILVQGRLAMTHTSQPARPLQTQLHRA